MRLNKQKISEIVTRYDSGNGEKILALAEAFSTTPPKVRAALKAAGVLTSKPRAAPLDLAALMAHPALQAAIEGAVTARVAQLGAGGTVPQTQTDDYKAFTASLSHLIEVQSMQQAGYIKPLPAEEIDRRAGALIEMRALLKDFEARGDAPEYIVGESGFFECTNALEFPSGATIRTFLLPVEDFVPVTEAAKKVHAAMLVWIGGHTPGIGEQLEAAMKAANQSAPLVTGTLSPMTSRPQTVQLVDVPVKQQPRKRMTGTLTPERHDVSLAERAAGPQGPVFVGDRAAA